MSCCSEKQGQSGNGCRHGNRSFSRRRETSCSSGTEPGPRRAGTRASVSSLRTRPGAQREVTEQVHPLVTPEVGEQAAAVRGHLSVIHGRDGTGGDWNSGADLSAHLLPEDMGFSFVLLSLALSAHFSSNGRLWGPPPSRPTAKRTASGDSHQAPLSGFKASWSPT